LEFVAAAVKEEREDQGAVFDPVVGESVFEQRRLSGTRFSLDPEQASLPGHPAPVRLVVKQPPACPLNGTANLIGADMHLRKGQ
jgi:hypothetical protein